MNTPLESCSPATPSKKPHRLKAEILLVDDDPAIRHILARFLTGEGYSVSLASNGAGALELAGRTDFDLVLLDLSMPGKDGWDTFEQLTTQDPLLQIIIITARSNEQFTALAAGIGALMEKPLDLQKLSLTIRELLDEPESVRLARVAGRSSKFHYIPPTLQESDNNTKPRRKLRNQ